MPFILRVNTETYTFHLRAENDDDEEDNLEVSSSQVPRNHLLMVCVFGYQPPSISPHPYSSKCVTGIIPRITVVIYPDYFECPSTRRRHHLCMSQFRSAAWFEFARAHYTIMFRGSEQSSPLKEHYRIVKKKSHLRSQIYIKLTRSNDDSRKHSLKFSV